MAYKIPWSNFHELNLDWLLQQVKNLREDVDGLIGSATPCDDTPEMDGAGTPGTSVSYSRGDHRHPTDTSRAAASDLTQEITDRGNADITLQTNIDAVDAKIKFSAAAPLMDSSSASAGFSDFLARADHVHPTDTSRASATDLAVLEARVDGFTGSALPSDLTPNMDGVASAGTGGNYSRGDHVHPSDTSKFDKTGGTISGSVTMTGVLRQSKLRGYKTISATGWLRVATVPNSGGNSVDICIQRRGSNTPAEIHRVSLLLDDTPSFCNEVSRSTEFFVDKIRYTNAGKVDIHIDQNYSSSISVYIEPHTVLDSELAGIEIVNPFDYVPAAPVGETIITSFDLTADTDAFTTVSLSSITLNPGNNTVTSISVPAGKHYIEGYMVIRTATQMQTLLSVGSSFHQTSKGWFNGLSFLIPVSGASITVQIYNYETAATTTTEGEIVYKFV